MKLEFDTAAIAVLSTCDIFPELTVASWLDTSAGTGKLCILGHLGLVFIWSCFVSCLLFLLFYVSLRNLCSGTCRKIQLVAVFKVSCFSFLNCFASFLLDIIFLPALPSRTVYSLLLDLGPREKISSPILHFFCSRKPLTYPGSNSVQCGLYGRTECPLLQALTFFTQTSSSINYWTPLLSRK